MNVLKVIDNNSFKESFYGKKKKQLIFWQFFLFLIKIMSNFFLNELLTIVLRAPINMIFV